MLQRKVYQELLKWKNSKKGKALCVIGARQIGKTTLIREFGANEYEYFAEINFVTDKNAFKIFDGKLTAKTIITNMTAYLQTRLEPGKTLILFDEVQECPQVRAAIKFLVEDGRFDYIESGSLLGVRYKEISSYPVGFEQILQMYPLDFEEYMWANGIQSSTFEYLKECYDNTTKVSDEALEKEYGSKAIIKTEDTADVVTTPAKKELTEPEPPVTTITATVPKTEVVEPPKLQIPPRPVMPPEAAAFPRLQKIKVTLDKQNHLIFEAERERNKLEIKLSDLKGLARLTKKKELESRIATKNEEIRTLKAGLSGIVRQYGFATVQDFYTAFYTAQRVTDAYQKECAKWEETYGEKATPKAESMHEKLQRYQEKADRQNANQPHRSRDKGAR